MQTDVVVIGGGPGGYAAAIRASQLGRRTMLVEKEKLGGACLNWGCIPSKALIHGADVLATVRAAADYGIAYDNLSWDFSQTAARSRAIVDKQAQGLQFLMRKNGIEVLTGTARFTDGQTLAVTDASGAVTSIAADCAVIAVGARARALPHLPFDGQTILSAREAVALADLPARAAIVGGGAVGVEFAHIWHTFGVDVTLIEYEDRLLPLEDGEISAELTKQFRGRGIKVLTGCAAQAYDPQTRTLALAARQAADCRAPSAVAADAVLVAVGIRPNTENLGLAQAGVALDEAGFIPVDAYLRTRAPRIYAVGDCTGRLPLAHVALAQAVTAAESLAAADPVPLRDEQYRFMPRCTYAAPQVASLGYTEEALLQAGIAFNKGATPLFPNGKAKAMGIRRGFVKILAGKEYGELLGAHMIGPDVTELLPSLSLAQAMELTPVEIARTTHAHPTLSEAVMEAAAAVEGLALHM